LVDLEGNPGGRLQGWELGKEDQAILEARRGRVLGARSVRVQERIKVYGLFVMKRGEVLLTAS
jgi:hypothetical protein